MGEFPLALRDMERVLALGPATAEQEDHTRTPEGEEEAEREAARQAEREHTERRAFAHANRAAAWLGLGGREGEAIASLERAVELAPNQATMRQSLAQLRVQGGRVRAQPAAAGQGDVPVR